MPDGDVKEAKEILETRSATRGVFDKFPDIAKQALQRSWNDAQKLLDNAKDYFSEENTIALLAQITYENDGATISISVRNDAKDNLSMR